MSPEEALHEDDRLVELLVACDTALEYGLAIPTAHDLAAELLPRLGQDLAALKLLRGALRHTGPAPANAELRLDRFHLLRELGRGAHGIVFLAHDPHLGRAVALKVPR